MSQLATITTKRQLTIPVSVYKKVKLFKKQKVLVTVQDGSIIITPFLDKVEKLAGSLQTLKKWRGKNIDEIIETSKQEYFVKRK